MQQHAEIFPALADNSVKGLASVLLETPHPLARSEQG
jgi:hypothetical protein